MTALLHRFSSAALCTLLVIGGLLAGCDILGVDNPNNLREEDLEDPASARPMANGAEAAVARALGAVLAPISTASDELTLTGSRDAWRQLDIGNIEDPANEFSDAAFPYVGEARWTTDEYIERLNGFLSNEDLELTESDRTEIQTQLVRVYLYGAIIYTSIADFYDEFVIGSDRAEGGEPVAPGSMNSLYATALEYVTAGLEAGEQAGADGQFTTALLAMRARVLHNRGIWAKVNPVNTGDPLVNNSEAVAAAQAALDRIGENDFTFELVLDSSTPDLVVTDLSMALQINDRGELGFASSYADIDEDGNFTVTYPDPISGDVDPRLQRYISGFIDEVEFADIPIVSKAEMRLILAEAALAGNPDVDFETQINALRELGSTGENDPLPDWSSSSSVSPRDILISERRINLFLQGRRLADHYRFGQDSPEWVEGVKNEDGTFLPISITEIRANENVN